MDYLVEDARYVRDFVIWLRFRDGTTGEVDLSRELWGTVFEPLRDVEYFKRFTVHPELKTLVWPNGGESRLKPCAERDFALPGRLVEFDGRRSHIYCTGQGSPTILLESGLDDRGSWGWDHLRAALSQVSRVCAYDRAGTIWSEPREGPRDAERIAGELHALRPCPPALGEAVDHRAIATRPDR